MTGVLVYSLQLALGILLPWWVVRRDQRRLTPEQLQRTWNEASFRSAIVAFGPLCLPVHFTKARGSFRGLLLGLLWMAGVIAALSAADWLLSELSSSAPER